MSLFDKLNLFHDKYYKIIKEYNKCRDNIFDIKQHEFEIKDRIEKSKNLINECDCSKNDQLKILFNSDADFRKYYDTKFPNNFTENIYKKDIVDYLSKKYDNIIINNEKFVERCPSKPSLIEKQYKEKYIFEMLSNEFNELKFSYKPFYCLDQKLFNKFIEQKCNEFNIKHTDIVLYPSHSDYIKCIKDRKNL